MTGDVVHVHVCFDDITAHDGITSATSDRGVIGSTLR